VCEALLSVFGDWTGASLGAISRSFFGSPREGLFEAKLYRLSPLLVLKFLVFKRAIRELSVTTPYLKPQTQAPPSSTSGSRSPYPFRD